MVQRLRSSVPSQLSIRFTVLFLSKLSRFVAAIGNLMDEEGEMSSKLITKANDIIELQNAVLKMSSTPVNTNNHGYTIRLISKTVMAVGRAVRDGAAYLMEEYRKYKENVYIDPFVIWDTSGDKVKISCSIESDSGKQTEFGSFEMDLDAPCSVMRLYLRKNFRELLNDSCGDSFLFFGIVEERESILDREAEENTESRVYVQLTISDTDERMYKILIMRDKAEEFAHIPEFVSTENEKDGDIPEEPVLNEKVSAHYI